MGVYNPRGVFPARAFRTKPDTAICTAAVAIIAIIVAHWFRPGFMLGSVDFFPDFSPSTLLFKSFDAWGHVKSPIGGYDFPTYAPLYAFSAVASAVIGSSAAQLLLSFIAIASAWVGAYATGRTLGLTQIACAAAATFYALGPEAQSVVTWITGSAFIAIFPWIVCAILRSSLYPSERRAISLLMMLLALFALPLVGSTPQLFFEFLLGAGAFALYALTVLNRSAEYRVWLARTTAIAATCALWWAIPVVVAILSSQVTRATASGSVAWTFANASWLNDLRFISAWTWAYVQYTPYAARYDGNPLLYVSGFLGAIGLCVAAAYSKGRQAILVRFLLIVVLVALLITKGLHAPFAPINELLYKVPGLVLLIEPAGAAFVGVFCVALALGVSLDIALEFLGKRSQSARIATGIAVTLLAAASSTPLWTGACFRLGDNRTMYVALPQYWREAAAYVDADPVQGSALILPPDDFYERAYTWGYDGVDIIPASIFSRATLIPGPSLDYLDDPRNISLVNVLATYARQDPSELLTAARSLGVAFIICRNDVAAGPTDCGLRENTRGVHVRRFGNLLVGRLNEVQPQVPIWRRWISGSYAGFTPGSMLELGNATKALPRFNEDPRVASAGLHGVVTTESTRTTTIDRSTALVAASSAQTQLRNIRAEIPFQAAVAFDADPAPFVTLDGFVPNGRAALSGIIQPAVSAIERGKNGSLLRIYNPSFETLPARLIFPDARGSTTGLGALALRPGTTEIALPRVSFAVARMLQIHPTEKPASISTSDTSILLLNSSSHAILTGPPLGAALADTSSVEVDDVTKPGAEIGLLISYRRGAQHYLCYAPSGASAVWLDQAIGECERTNRLTYPNAPAIVERFDIDVHTNAPVLLLNSTIDDVALFTLGAVSRHRAAATVEPSSEVLVGQRGSLSITLSSRADGGLVGHAVAATIGDQSVNGIVQASSPTTLTIRKNNTEATYLLSDVAYISPVTAADSTLQVRFPASAAQCIAFLVRNSAPLRLRVTEKGGTEFNLALATGTHDLCVPSLVSDAPVLATLTVPKYSLPGKIGQLAIAQESVDDAVTLYRNGRPAAIITPASPQLSNVSAGPISDVRGPFSALRIGAPLQESNASSATMLWGFGSLRSFSVPCGGCLLLDGQLYGSGWIGLQVTPHPGLLLHSQAGLWQNAWFPREPGIIFVFNIVSAAEYAFLLLGLALLARTLIWR
jgi:hypothetical protein